MIDPATGEAIGGVGPPTLGANWSDSPTSPLSLRQGQRAVRPHGGRRRRGDGQEVRPVRRRHHQDPVPGTAAGVHDLGHAGLRRGRQPGGCDARRVRRGNRAEGARQGGRVRPDRRRRRRRHVGAGPAIEHPIRAPEGHRGRQGVRRRRRTGEAVAGGPGILPDRAARVRVHRPVRGRVHHLQHLLDHRRAAHRRDGAAPSDRGQPAAGHDVGGGRSVRDRLDRIGVGTPRGRRDRAGPQGTAVRLRGRSAEHLAPARAAHHRRGVRGGHGRHGRVVDPPRPPRLTRGAGPGAPRVGGQRQRVAATPIDHRPHPDRGWRCGAAVRAVRQPVERGLPDRARSRRDVRGDRDPAAARHPSARGRDRSPDPTFGHPGQARA